MPIEAIKIVQICLAREQNTNLYNLTFLHKPEFSPSNSTSYKMIPISLFLHPSLIFPFLLLYFPVYHTEFLFICSQVPLSFLSCCHQATTFAANPLHTKKCFRIISIQTEIRLYLPFFDWFVTKRTSVLFQINRKMVNTIWFRFDLIRFGKDFSVCIFSVPEKFFHSGRAMASSDFAAS